MVLSLFRKAEPNPAVPLYAAVVAAARSPDWYVEAGIPDSIDGRYCVLVTLLAITDVRLERGGAAAAELAPRLTELFVDDLDVQLRESGLGDPTLGKTVRGLVGGLSGRISRWRPVLDGGSDEGWRAAISSSLYRDGEPDEAQEMAARRLVERWHERLAEADDEDLRRGLDR